MPFSRTSRHVQAAEPVADQVVGNSGSETLETLERRLAAETARVEEERAVEEGGLRDLEAIAAEERSAFGDSDRARGRAAVAALRERKDDANFRANSGSVAREHHAHFVAEILAQIARLRRDAEERRNAEARAAAIADARHKEQVRQTAIEAHVQAITESEAALNLLVQLGVGAVGDELRESRRTFFARIANQSPWAQRVLF